MSNKNKKNNLLSKTIEIKKKNNFDIYKKNPNLKKTFDEFIKVNSQKNHPFGTNEKRFFFSIPYINLNDLEKRMKLMGYKINDNLKDGIGNFINIKCDNKNLKNKPKLNNSIEKYKEYCNPILFDIYKNNKIRKRNQYYYNNDYNCDECYFNLNPKKLIKSNSYNKIENNYYEQKPYFIKQYTHHLLY